MQIFLHPQYVSVHNPSTNHLPVLTTTKDGLHCQSANEQSPRRSVWIRWGDVHVRIKEQNHANIDFPGPNMDRSSCGLSMFIQCWMAKGSKYCLALDCSTKACPGEWQAIANSWNDDLFAYCQRFFRKGNRAPFWVCFGTCRLGLFTSNLDHVLCWTAEWEPGSNFCWQKMPTVGSIAKSSRHCFVIICSLLIYGSLATYSHVACLHLRVWFGKALSLVGSGLLVFASLQPSDDPRPWCHDPFSTRSSAS